MMLETQPHYFKIDRFFVRGAENDHYRRAVVESIAQLAAKFGARVVAEGVETDSDLRVVTALGITLFQGYFFSPPVAVQAAAGFKNESWAEKEFSASTIPISSC
jgi:EAL domain-containing protein (putative c-di-GMP-specific phosphodiesterase class I)